MPEPSISTALTPNLSRNSSRLTGFFNSLLADAIGAINIRGSPSFRL